MRPMIRPSTINGARTKKSVAPMSFIMAISSLRTAIPMVTVLLMRKMDTSSRMPMMATDT